MMNLNKKSVADSSDQYQNDYELLETSVAVSLAVAVAGSVLGFLAKNALERIVGTDPVDLSHDAIEVLATRMRAAVDEGRKDDYLTLVKSTQEKFHQWNTTDPKQDFLLENIITENTNALTGLFEFGTGTMVAWITAVNNVLTAYLLLNQNETAKGVAQRHLDAAVSLLTTARTETNNRLGPCFEWHLGVAPESWWYKNEDYSCNAETDNRCITFGGLKEETCNTKRDAEMAAIYNPLNNDIFIPLDNVIEMWKQFSESYTLI
jgi:hypothetical protein